MVVMNSSNTGNTKQKIEHNHCGTDKCCMQCDTAVGDTPPEDTLRQLEKEVINAKNKDRET